MAMRREHLAGPVKQVSGIKKSGRVFGQGQRTAKTIRTGLYACISTPDQQTLPMQNRAMREHAARRGWTIALQVKEIGSGAARRQLREKLLEAAQRREIDAVLVWRPDRGEERLCRQFAFALHSGLIAIMGLCHSLLLTLPRPCPCAVRGSSCRRSSSALWRLISSIMFGLDPAAAGAIPSWALSG